MAARLLGHQRTAAAPLYLQIYMFHPPGIPAAWRPAPPATTVATRARAESSGGEGGYGNHVRIFKFQTRDTSSVPQASAETTSKKITA